MRFYTSAIIRGDDVLLREIDGNERRERRVQYAPTLYAPATGPSGFSTIYGKSVTPLAFDSISGARRAMDTHPELYGMDRWTYPFLDEEYPGHVEYDLDAVVVAILDIEVGSDAGVPDPMVADKPVTAISVKTRDVMYTFGLYEFVSAESDVVYARCRDEQDMLRRFVETWATLRPDVVTGWNIERFDIPYLVNRITRMFGSSMARRLSPWGRLEKRRVAGSRRPGGATGSWQSEPDTEIQVPLGVALLDYMAIFKNKNLVPAPYESYSLNAISVVELGEAKLDYSEFEGLLDLYRRDYDKFIRYNQRDVRLVEKLERKRGLIALILSLAYRAKVNYEDVLSSSRPWDAMTHNYLLGRGRVVPRSPREQEPRPLMGGFVKDVRAGYYRWVVNFDVTSEYPSTMIACNISPDTYAGKVDCPWIHDDDKGRRVVHVDEFLARLPDLRARALETNTALAVNGAFFRRGERGFIPDLLADFFDERVRYKNTAQEQQKLFEATRDPVAAALASRYDTLQMAAKISLNACYGCLSNRYYRWYDIDLAEAVTSTGQLTIRWAERTINAHLNETLGTEGIDYVLAIDTDSTYVHLGPLVERVFGTEDADPAAVIEFLDRACRDKIQPLLEHAFSELAVMLNVREPRIEMKREYICASAIWTAAKNYILDAYDKEGVRYARPRTVVKGIKAVKPSTPEICRRKIDEAFRLILSGDKEGIIDFVASFESEFKTLSFEEIAFSRSISNLVKYEGNGEDVLCGPGTPIQVRGALLYNSLLAKHGIHTSSPIHDGDKARYCYLVPLNPTRQHVITAPHGLPRQFGLDKYIDHKVMFEKAFLKPLGDIVQAIGWRLRRDETPSLEKFWE